MEPEYDFEKLAYEIVSSRLKEAEDAPSAAGEIAKAMTVKGVAGTRGKQDPRATVVAVCRGTMRGLLILEKDLPAAAVAVLGHMGEVANDSGLDPADCMTWAMEGIAPVAKLSPAGPDPIRAAIEEKFMGAGEVFDSVVRSSGA